MSENENPFLLFLRSLLPNFNPEVVTYFCVFISSPLLHIFQSSGSLGDIDLSN